MCRQPLRQFPPACLSSCCFLFCLAPQSRIIRLPVHVHDFLNRVRKATLEMTDKNGKLPTDEELAEHLEVSAVRIQVRFFILLIHFEVQS